MIDLSADNAAAYLRETGRISGKGELLVRTLFSGSAGTSLQVFDTGGGEKIGSDLRTAGQKKLGRPDMRMNEGSCLVIRQHRAADAAAGETPSLTREQTSLELMATLLPAGSVPAILWCDQENAILATSCPPLGAVNWEKELVAGRVSIDAATHAGMLLAMMHSATHEDAVTAKAYEALQQPLRIAAEVASLAQEHAELAGIIKQLAARLSTARHCVVHGNFVPENLFLAPRQDEPDTEDQKKSGFPLSHLMITDFAQSGMGHAAADVCSLVANFLARGFGPGKKWRPLMMLADNFWQTYRHTAAPPLVRATDAVAGHLIGGLFLLRARVAEPSAAAPVRAAGIDLLKDKDSALEHALDAVSLHFEGE